jgi:hexosaminidase
LFYGVQTVLQLLPPEIYSSNIVKGVAWQIPCVNIADSPRFQWRGMMLDVARHFFTKEEVKKTLDAMALHKLNVFHWHLTDDQGWRIEIKKYPKLLTEGAWRNGVGFGLATNSTTAYGPDGRYGGFYSQEDIREIVAYASARHISIVPEIDMPGHSSVALRAYPEVSCSDGPSLVYSPAKEETYQFLEGVLTEVFELFPGQYIHVGGDEVNPGPWTKDPACQALMKREGLKTTSELENWFIKRIATFVHAHGKTLIGWSEIAHGGGLPEKAALMHYNGGGHEAAELGHDVVMTPTGSCYLNLYQSCDHVVEPLAFGGFLPLETVYAFEPIPKGLAADKQKHILGAQGSLWGECIANLKLAEYMLFPRLSALAEVTWSPQNARNLADFKRRLITNEQRLDQLGVHYRSSTLGNGTDTIGVKVGEWKPEQIKTEPALLEWDVTKKVTAAGKVRVSLEFIYGTGIKSDWVALLEDGREISCDAHAAICSRSARVARYMIDVPAPKAGAKYTLRAQVVSDANTSKASGAVFWLYDPANK